MRLVPCLLLPLTLACAGGTALEPAPVGEPFVLRYGESVLVPEAQLRIHFREVVDDTRCPIDVLCIAAGNAKIRLEVRPRGFSHLLEFGYPLGPPVQEVERALIRLVALRPPAPAPGPVRPQSYEVELQVDVNSVARPQ